MEGALRLSGHREPLGLWRHRVAPPLQHPGLRSERIEYASRGDRVSGRMWQPAQRKGERPIVLLQHRAGESSACAEIESVAAHLAARGAAVVAVDFPLHGARGDAKLGARLGAAFCSLDPRVRAAALAFPGAGDGAAALDARTYVARIAPRPLLLVHAGSGDPAAARGARALFDAASEPKQECRIGDDLPGDAAVLDALERFLSPALELPPA